MLDQPNALPLSQAKECIRQRTIVFITVNELTLAYSGEKQQRAREEHVSDLVWGKTETYFEVGLEGVYRGGFFVSVFSIAAPPKLPL